MKAVPFKMNTLVLPDLTDDLEEIAGVGVTGLPEHTHYTLGGLPVRVPSSSNPMVALM